MSRADILQEIRELRTELKDRRIYNSALQLRAFRRRLKRLHRMLDGHAHTRKQARDKETQLTLSL
jgi:hypothetical protein